MLINENPNWYKDRLNIPYTSLKLITPSYRNRKLLISRAPPKAKSQEPAYSHALNQNKIDRQRSRSRQADSQTAMVDGAWS